MNRFVVTLSNQDIIKAIARETAKMSYPGSMSRGIKQVLKKNGKKAVEDFFVDEFDLFSIWKDPKKIAYNYDAYHEKWARDLAVFLKNHRPPVLGRNHANNPATVSTKFINTFMHQLMKYEQFRSLWKHLHLPLDSQVFKAFRKYEGISGAIKPILKIIKNKSAYAISYREYQNIQTKLQNFIAELNQKSQIQFNSRIELNLLLWADEGILFRDFMVKFKPKHRHGEWNLGPPVGKEIW